MLTGNECLCSDQQIQIVLMVHGKHLGVCNNIVGTVSYKLYAIGLLIKPFYLIKNQSTYEKLFNSGK